MKKNLRKCGVLLLCLTLLLGLSAMISGCGSTDKPTPADDGCITIVCTNFAGFDLTRGLLKNDQMVGGEGDVDLILLGKDGQDMHSYEPTAADIITIGTADILVCVGAEQWLDAAISSSGNADVVRVDMMEVCDTIEEEHDHDHGLEEDSCAIIGTDEHVWLSVENAIRIHQAIEDAICRVDADHAYAWQSSGEEYRAELTALWGEYTAMMASAARDTVVIADRHPFAYLFRDLGLNCVAAFPGCSSETGAEVLTLNSMQVVTDRESTYIQIMKQNLENLKKALQ